MFLLNGDALILLNRNNMKKENYCVSQITIFANIFNCAIFKNNVFWKIVNYSDELLLQLQNIFHTFHFCNRLVLDWLERSGIRKFKNSGLLDAIFFVVSAVKTCDASLYYTFIIYTYMWTRGSFMLVFA